ncbi:MAG: UDP-N-acetylmuramoyl-tripeptide--D-alanyl-D-alanine ligase [Dongiaceae bacterium]
MSWSADDVAKATKGKTASSWQASRVVIDSRQVRPGDLFVALSGPHFDGHDFVGQALSAGAVAAVVSKAPRGIMPQYLVEVSETLQALKDLGRFARSRSQAKIIAVGGSVGKTSTKEALKYLLSRQGKTHSTEANNNNQIGVPLTLANLPLDAQFAVIEVGTDRPGELAPLSHLSRPKVGIITAIAPAHVEFFPSIEAMVDEEGEIFAAMGQTDTAIINRDTPFYDRLLQSAASRKIERIIGFGTHPLSQARLLAVQLQAQGSEVEAEILGNVYKYYIGAPGHHWALNSLAILAAVSSVGADIEEAASSLRHVAAIAGRGQQHRIACGEGSILLIDESYNSNPGSLTAALQVLAATPIESGGRRIAVLGDMLELGGKSPDYHAQFSDVIESLPIDLVFTCGRLMRYLQERLPRRLAAAYTADSKALADELIPALRAGDVVMVKGSLGSKMQVVVDALRTGKELR